jgi:hypothetical protein
VTPLPRGAAVGSAAAALAAALTLADADELALDRDELPPPPAADEWLVTASAAAVRGRGAHRGSTGFSTSNSVIIETRRRIDFPRSTGNQCADRNSAVEDTKFPRAFESRLANKARSRTAAMNNPRAVDERMRMSSNAANPERDPSDPSMNDDRGMSSSVRQRDRSADDRVWRTAVTACMRASIIWARNSAHFQG